MFVIAVPTRSTTDHAPDLSLRRDGGARRSRRAAAGGDLVILESTSPPGTTEQLGRWIAEERPDLRTPRGDARSCVAHCPERVLPGRVMVELVENDRIVGGITPRRRASGRASTDVLQGELILTDARTAELVKLVENAYRDVNIAFANELSLICDALGVDVWELIALANRHPRVNILQPGPGVGGHCIAVDPWFIVAAAPEQTRLIRTAREVNDAKPEPVVQRGRGAGRRCRSTRA